jgi:putative ABC transport system permease protein
MSGALSDLRHALRLWWRAPILASLTIVMLALATGAGLAVVATVDALYVRTLPVQHADRLVRLVRADGDTMVNSAVWEVLRDDQPILERVAAFASRRVRIGHEGTADRVDALLVSGSFFEALGVGVGQGRAIGPGDDTVGAAPVAVITEGMRQALFGDRAVVAGLTLDVEGQTVEIVGVTAGGFSGVEVGRHSQIILPISLQPSLQREPDAASPHGPAWLQVLGRLAPGQTPAQAGAALRAWQPALREATAPADAGRRHLDVPLDFVAAATGVSPLRRQFGPALAVLAWAVAAVLLVACANLAAALLARFADRQQELRVRLALGATRTRILRSLLIEALLLTAAGSAGGVLLALWLVPQLLPLLSTPLDRGAVPYLPLTASGRLVLIAAGTSLLTGLASGILPAMRASRGSGGGLAMGRQISSAGWRRHMLVLVSVQVALTFTLVSGAAVLVRSFVALTTQHTAVDRDRALLAAIEGEVFDANPDVTTARLEAILVRARSVPGVQAASLSTLTPLSGLIMLSPVEVRGFSASDGRDVNAAVNRVTPDFFEVFGTRIVAGRSFRETDDRLAPGVAIVNTDFVRRYLPETEPLGQVVRLGTRDLEIVGVVESGKYRILQEAPLRFVYVPLQQWLRQQPLRLAVRTDTPRQLGPALIRTFRDFEPPLALELRTLEDEVASSANRERLLAWTGTLVSGLAVLVAALGLYATLTYFVGRRRQEFGVRMALGADRRAIVALVGVDTIFVLVAGGAAGIAASRLTGRTLEHVLFGVEPADWVATGLAVGLLAVVAAAASVLPARRAAGVDPNECLRAE